LNHGNQVCDFQNLTLVWFGFRKPKTKVFNGFCSLLGRQEAQLLLEKADRTGYIRSLAFEFQSWRENDLSEVRQFHACYVNDTLPQKVQ